MELLKSDGIAIDLDEIARIAGTERIGRPHLADALLRRKIVRTKQEASIAFSARETLLSPRIASPLPRRSPDKGRWRNRCRGHPYSLFVSKPRLAALMDEWKEAVWMGLRLSSSGETGQCRSSREWPGERLW